MRHFSHLLEVDAGADLELVSHLTTVMLTVLHPLQLRRLHIDTVSVLILVY